MFGSHAATWTMSVSHHGCFSSFGGEHYKFKLPQCNLKPGCSNMGDLFELPSWLFLLVALEHAAHAQGLGPGSDICSHTSGSLAAPVFCLQLCSHCCVPTAGVSDLEVLAAGPRQSQTNVFFFFFPITHSHFSVQMLMIHPKGNIYTRCRFLLCEWTFFELRFELSWLPETVLTTHSTCQSHPSHSTNLVFLSLSLSLSLCVSQLSPFRLCSLYCSPIQHSLALNHLYSELYLDIFLSPWSQSSPLAHFSQDCSNYVQVKAVTLYCSESEGEITVMTYDLLSLIRGNLHVSWLMKTSIWSGRF